MFMLAENDVWTAAQRVGGMLQRMESHGVDIWHLLGEIVEGIASFGPSGYIRDRIRDFWQPVWHAMGTLAGPSHNIAVLTAAMRDATNSEMQAMLDQQKSLMTDQVTMDNQKMQTALSTLHQHFDDVRQANQVLHDTLYYYIPDAIALIADTVDILDTVEFVGAAIATGGIALIATEVFVAELLAENYELYNAGILNGYAAVGIWLLVQRHDYGELPSQIAYVAANPPIPWVEPLLEKDMTALKDNQCPISAINSFTSNPQITSGYIHEIVQYHPDEACTILTDIDTVTRNAPQIGIGGIVALEDDLRLGGITFTGALFHIQWLAHHPSNISGIEIPSNTSDRPDAILTNGNQITIVDCKSVNNITYSKDSDLRNQARRYQATYKNAAIEYVFDGDKLTGKYQQHNLDAIKAMQSDGLEISVVLSPDEAAKNPQFVNDLKALGITPEIWDHISE